MGEAGQAVRAHIGADLLGQEGVHFGAVGDGGQVLHEHMPAV